MSRSHSGSITQWNDAAGDGLVTEHGDGVHVLDASDCSDQLLSVLRGKAIPPDTPVPVIFDVDIRNHAINVDLAAVPELAAAPARSEMLTESVQSKKAAAKKLPKKAAKKAAKKATRKKVSKRATKKRTAAKRPSSKRASKARKATKKSRRSGRKRK